MLPILITILIIGGVLAVVYLVGSRPSKKEAKPKAGQRSKTAGQKSRPVKRRSRFQEPPLLVRKLPLILVVGAV
ncbi:MAG: hypothetical protein M3O29_04555, partial [Actinomycetota bacterium]|nr:hypothetical protein [Actinomycetota bacterium]